MPSGFLKRAVGIFAGSHTRVLGFRACRLSFRFWGSGSLRVSCLSSSFLGLGATGHLAPKP